VRVSTVLIRDERGCEVVYMMWDDGEIMLMLPCSRFQGCICTSWRAGVMGCGLRRLSILTSNLSSSNLNSS
jgi:hypothetical protein